MDQLDDMLYTGWANHITVFLLVGPIRSQPFYGADQADHESSGAWTNHTTAFLLNGPVRSRPFYSIDQAAHGSPMMEHQAPRIWDLGVPFLSPSILVLRSFSDDSFILS